jgi:hypothetical protein
MTSFAWCETDAPSLNGAGLGLLRWRNHARSTLRKTDTMKISDHYNIGNPAARNSAPNIVSDATLQQMNRALKNLLLWLLISLLPIQGMAAVISASCSQAASVQHGATAHHAAQAHCPSDSVDTAADSASGSASDSAATHHASCSACAACCIGASAPPSTPAPATGHALSESRFAALGMPGNGFIPTGLERPPRFS